MNLYMVNLNNKTDIYSNINDIPFNLPEYKLSDLNENGKVSFFSNDGEVTLLFFKDNDKQLEYVFKKKKLLKNKYGEYTLLNNIGDDLKEVRCYENGFRQYIKDNGNIEWIFNNKLHSPSNDIPAVIAYYSDGSIYSKEYCIKDELHREEGPALIYYNTDESISSEAYYINNELHREDGPAIIHHSDNEAISCEEYYINGVKKKAFL
jgi:hypothetical protein